MVIRKGYWPRLRFNKIVILLLVLGLLNGGLYLLARVQFLSRFSALEQEVVHDNLARAYSSLQAEMEDLDTLAHDWASWDDLYRFMDQPTEAFRKTNLAPEFAADLHLDYLGLIAPDDHAVWQVLFDAEGEIAARGDGAVPSGLLPGASPVGREGKLGLRFVGGHPWMLVYRPILTSQGEGPANGVLIFGRLLDEEYLAQFAARNHMQVRILAISQDDLNRYFPSHHEPVADFDRHVVSVPVDDRVVEGYGLLHGLGGQHGLVMHLEVERKIYREGLLTTRSFLVWTLIASLLSAILVYLIMDRLAWSSARRRESEQRYQALNLEFRTILDGIPSAITLVRKDLGVAWANRAAALYYGYDSLDAGGRDPVGLQHSSSLSAEECPVRLCLASGVRQEALEEHSDGRHVSIKAFPVLSQAGEVVNVVCHATDITEKVRMRAENEEAGRLAALGELSAGIAHEINNPNGMIMLNLGLIADVWDDLVIFLAESGMVQDDLELGGMAYQRLKNEMPALLIEMHQGGERIKAIVEDLKAFARREEDSHWEDVDLAEVVNASERLVDNVVRKSGAEYSVVFGDCLPAVRGNFRQLEQVVINLLVNACQALESSGKRIAVRLYSDLALQEVVLVVEDEGIGISQDALAKITDPFFTTKRSEGGTGLGLSISARIVREHGGRLRFSSAPGCGTAAELRLPMAE